MAKIKIKKNPVMASFQAKISWKRRRKGENKNCLSVPFVLDGKYKITKKEKKNKKNTIVASFQDKIGWKMPRKRKNKNCLSVPFRSDW